MPSSTIGGHFNSELPFLLWCSSFLHSSTAGEFGVVGSPSCIFPFFWDQDGSLKICKDVMGFYMCHKHGEVAFYRVPSTFFFLVCFLIFLGLGHEGRGGWSQSLGLFVEPFCNVWLRALASCCSGALANVYTFRHADFSPLTANKLNFSKFCNLERLKNFPNHQILVSFLFNSIFPQSASNLLMMM